eukprot:55245_1
MTHLSIALLTNLSDALRSAILGGMSETHRDTLRTVARIALWPARYLNPATAPSAPPCPPGDRPADRPEQKEEEAPPAPGQDPSPLAETPVEDPPVKAPPRAGASLSTDEAYDYYSFEDSASGGVDEESEDPARGVSPYTSYAYNISYSLDEESEDSDMEAREAYSIEEEDEISPYSYYSTESSDEVHRTASAMGSPLASLSSPLASLSAPAEDLLASLNTALGRPSSAPAEDLMASLSAALGASSDMDAGMLGSVMENLRVQ